MNILIAGGAGYIGSMLTPRLLNNLGQNDTVHVVDNFRCQQKPLLNICEDKRFGVTCGDCRDLNTMKPLLAKADVIIWLAAIVGAEACDIEPHDARTTNLDAVSQMLEMVSKDQRILYPCTNSGYGVGANDLFCTEETPMRPISLYGKTKAEAESRILQRDNSISFRLATVFGASLCMRTELLVNNFVLRALRDRAIVLFEAHYKRNYVHVLDVADAFVFGVKNFDNLKGQAYNLGLSSANVSKYELCEVIKKQIDFEIICCDNRKDIDQRNYIVSNAKIESKGFSAVRTLDDGVEELKKAYTISIGSYHGKAFGY